MALELFSESWAGWPVAAPSPVPGAASPRISFSRDLDGSTTLDHHHHHHHLLNQQRSDSSLLDSSSPDFDFCVSHDRPEQEYSSAAADELFSDGFLLPLPILRRGAGAPSALPSLPTRTTTTTTTSTTTATSSFSSSVSCSRSRLARPLPTPQAEEGKDSTEEISIGTGSGGSAEEKPVAGKQPSSFWKFGRSSSLNCSASTSGGGAGSGGRRASLICSLPLLSRSKSTGSNPSPNALKQRQQSFNNATATSSGCKLSRKGSGNGGAAARNPYYYGQHHHGGGGVRISPVLNVPPPYIPKGSGAGLFSFGHLLCSSRERSRKKTQHQTPTPPQQQRS